MANVATYGAMTAADALPGYFATAGAQAVWDTTTETLAAYSARVQQSFAPFVERTTTQYMLRYLSAAGGEMQEVDSTNDMGQTAEVKGGTSWDVAFPMRGFRDRLGTSERVLAMLSKEQYDNRVQAVKNRYLATYRRQTIQALFRNTSYSYTDPINGTLTVQPLANGDATLYATLDPAGTPATRNNYFGAAADWTTLADAKNPLPTIVARLRLLFGVETAAQPIVVFLNSAQEAGAETLADFVEVPQIYVSPAAASATLAGYPRNLPGRVIGKSDGALLVAWDQIPSGYLIGIHMAAAPPLIRRVDPPAFGTSPNLVLTNPAGDYDHPMVHWRFETWFGLGVGNRLNGVAYDLTGTTPGTYTIPTSVA